MSTKVKDPRKLWVSQIPTGDSGQDLSVTIHAYCDNPDCIIRTVSAKANDFEQELPELLKEGPTCPLCRVQMIFDWHHKPIESTRDEILKYRLEKDA